MGYYSSSNGIGIIVIQFNIQSTILFQFPLRTRRNIVSHPYEMILNQEVYTYIEIYTRREHN